MSRYDLEMESGAWRLLRALIAFALGLLLIPVVIASLSYALALRRMALHAVESLIKP